jgi:hypothetical protein
MSGMGRSGKMEQKTAALFNGTADGRKYKTTSRSCRQSRGENKTWWMKEGRMKDLERAAFQEYKDARNDSSE